MSQNITFPHSVLGGELRRELTDTFQGVHAEKPLHVMIGGGDQIYQDSVRVSGPLRQWTDISNPKKRRAYPFTSELRDKCDE